MLTTMNINYLKKLPSTILMIIQDLHRWSWCKGKVIPMALTQTSNQFKHIIEWNPTPSSVYACLFSSPNILFIILIMHVHIQYCQFRGDRSLHTKKHMKDNNGITHDHVGLAQEIAHIVPMLELPMIMLGTRKSQMGRCTLLWVSHK